MFGSSTYEEYRLIDEFIREGVDGLLWVPTVSEREAPAEFREKAATLLPEHDVWEHVLGGRWVRGVSMHPERGPLRLLPASTSPPLGDLGEQWTIDEAYSRLRVSPSSDVGLVHAHDGDFHPACWTLERDGRRTGYSSLGHDPEAYAAPVAGEVLRRLTSWLLLPPSA